MNVLFFMIGISLLMALGFLCAFFWSMKTGQQDDLYTPSMRMLLEDTAPDEVVQEVMIPDPTRQIVLNQPVTAV